MTTHRAAPLQGKTVVVTRGEADSEVLANRLQGLGANVVCVPSVYVRRMPPGPALHHALAQLEHTAWVAFASRQGARFFDEALREQRVSLPGSVKLAAVGPGTAATVKTLWGKVHLVASESTAEGLAAALCAQAKPTDGAVTLPAALSGRAALGDALQAAGFVVHRLPIYETVPASAADGRMVLPPAVHYVLFTSPSTVQGFLARAAMPPLARVVSIGPTTSAAARAVGLAVQREAHVHTLDGLVDALVEERR